MWNSGKDWLEIGENEWCVKWCKKMEKYMEKSVFTHVSIIE